MSLFFQDCRDDVGGAQNTGMLGILVKTGMYVTSQIRWGGAWCTLLTPALGRRRVEDCHEFGAVRKPSLPGTRLSEVTVATTALAEVADLFGTLALFPPKGERK